MSALVLDTARLRLVLETTESVLARIDSMSPADRAQVSPEWVARMRSSAPSAWTHGFAIVERATNTAIGGAAFKGPPAAGAVEIAYGVDPDYRGRGYAKEAAAALVAFAFSNAAVRLVCAHTLPEKNPSTSVLTACGFEFLGEVLDPEDGLVWRWELPRDE
jgi:[ribosomal protein S5]-alanine N-acetyltransferase